MGIRLPIIRWVQLWTARSRASCFQKPRNGIVSKARRGKFLYELMARPGTTWHFLALAVFETAVPQSLVLIAEAIMSSLFSSFTHEVYRGFRLPELPYVHLDVSVNRSDPLEIDGHVLTNQVLQQRHYTLANALAGGPQNASVILGGPGRADRRR